MSAKKQAASRKAGPHSSHLTAMAQKPTKKPAAKSKPANAVKPKAANKAKPVAKKSSARKPPAKKPVAKKSAVKKSAPKAKTKPAPSKKPTQKPTPQAPKAAASAKKNIPSVKKAPPAKKTDSKPAAKSTATETKANGADKAVKAKPAEPAKPAPALAVVKPAKPEGKKSSKTPFMPPAPVGKPVPIPKAKRSVLDAAPEIVIKQVFNPKKMPPFYKKQMLRLRELRSALYDQLDGMAKDTLRSRPEGSDASVGGMHMGDAGSDAYDRDFALSMLSKEQDALYEINEALGRLDRGVYGVCELSGKKIPDERIEALPYTRYTREMQEQIERDNLGGKFRRPVVRSVFGLDDAAEEDDDEEGGTETPKETPPQESSLDFMKE
jgi:RNA polymerase-binding transcription factor DksA